MKRTIKPGIWTPWAEVLCFECHDKEGLLEGDGAPLDDERRGGRCDQCGAEVYVREDVAILSWLKARVGGVLEQTGGMCAALRLDVRGWVYIVSAQDKIIVGRYTPEQWDETAEGEAYVEHANRRSAVKYLRGILAGK